MKSSQNCWEAKKCGREPHGSNVNELGVCPAAVDTASDGLNGGKNGGRISYRDQGLSPGAGYNLLNKWISTRISSTLSAMKN